MLNMENGVETCSMLLEWPWLKLARAHHNRGDNTLTNTLGERIVTLSTILKININSWL
jgi:hypothetical protein